MCVNYRSVSEQTECTVCTVQNVWRKEVWTGVKRAKWHAVRTEYELRCHSGHRWMSGISLAMSVAINNTVPSTGCLYNKQFTVCSNFNFILINLDKNFKKLKNKEIDQMKKIFKASIGVIPWAVKSKMIGKSECNIVGYLAPLGPNTCRTCSTNSLLGANRCCFVLHM